MVHSRGSSNDSASDTASEGLCEAVAVGPYKAVYSLAQRVQEVEAIRRKYPKKVPVIIERYKKETSLPSLDRQKFLVPAEVTMSQFVTIVRSRLSLKPNQSLYFLISGKALASMSLTMAELYLYYQDKDGFIYYVCRSRLSLKPNQSLYFS